MGEDRRGLLQGVAAYLLWGAFPLYFPLLDPAGSVEVLLHRVLWSLVVVTGILAVRGQWQFLSQLRRAPSQVGFLSLAAVAISINWLTYIIAVTSGHVVEAALGYFLNPLVTVMLGVLVLRERLRPAQWTALGIGVVAVMVLAIDVGHPPWIAVLLAFSFGLYGLLKKQARVGPTESLFAETAVLLLPALIAVAVLTSRGEATFTGHGAGHMLLLMSTGVVTAIPLLLFGASAHRVPLSTMGLLQYLTPILQFIIGWGILGESIPAARWFGFALVWIALVVFTVDALGSGRRRAQQLRRATEAAAAA